MKIRAIFILFCLTVHAISNGQNRELLYDFDEIPGALMLNPGMKMSYQWYAGVPGLSGIGINAGTSGATVHDIFADDGVDINQKIREHMINGMTKRDEISGTFQVNLLQGGFRAANNTRNFYSFGWYLESDAIVYWPKDLAVLAWDGNADQLGRRFDLGHLKTRGELLSVFHFGINHIYNPKLILGARAKIYSIPLHMASTNNQGHFLTTSGQNNIFSHTLVADMLARSSGFNEIRNALDDDTVDEVSELQKILTKRSLLGGDLGFGIDLGFSYDLNESWVVTGSLLDLGLSFHSTDPWNYTLDGNITTEGVEVILPDALADPDSEFWEDLVDEIEAMVPFAENNDSYISFRPTKFYGSVRYNFGEPLSNVGIRSADCNCDAQASGSRGLITYTNSAGLQVFAINRPRGPQTAVTAFYTRRLGRLMQLKATYTADKFTKTNLGLGVNLQAGPIQFYAMADNLIGFKNLADTQYASFQIGLNIISWGAN
ncbi:MAG: DUF5723 family protein [Flavobacteriaceae bacterium]|nr:DUF5723 family protein [Flavobacteriaceae bacterium]